MLPYQPITPSKVAGSRYTAQVARIVDRLHVGQSGTDVVRALRRVMTGTAWSIKASRKRLYRMGLKRHAGNQRTYRRVMSGNYGRTFGGR